jgi:hypothetical protein
MKKVLKIYYEYGVGIFVIIIIYFYFLEKTHFHAS